ncbi:hypothetical protein [Kocuria massiliensis]|uniref:hypothetical protein n=1 Tax=Kocuria massiliensis TaxID=1926282 RepID=UPI00117B0C55|nr:hypothetical protein [Kocuria massiliensis]
MADETWLYLYENRGAKSIYIGIADRMDRVWQRHNDDAERLRGSSDTEILQTVQPFSSRTDALKAEAIAIHIAMLTGLSVLRASDDVLVEDGRVLVTNRAGSRSTSVLGPAVIRREGTVDYHNLVRTAIVTISAGDMNERRGPYGGTDGAAFSERAQKWWTVAADKQSRIHRLIAILSGSQGVILGDWDVDVGASYGADNNVFPLKNPTIDDPRGVKGMRLLGVSGQSGRIYSDDLRT